MAAKTFSRRQNSRMDFSIVGPSYREATSKNMLRTVCIAEKTTSLTLHMTQKSVHSERRGECLRGTTRLRCARVGATSRSDTRSGWLLHGGQSAEPTRTRGSFGQQLQGDLRRCAGRGSHCPPIALPAPSGYSSLSQHLRHRVYFRAGAYCKRWTPYSLVRKLGGTIGTIKADAAGCVLSVSNIAVLSRRYN